MFTFQDGYNQFKTFKTKASVYSSVVFVGKRAKTLIALAWIVSTLFSIPMLFLYEEKIVQGKFDIFF